MRPTEQEIEALHRRYAPTAEAFDLVFTHCRIVRDIALELCGDAVDVELVRIGALVHDVGVYRLYSPAGELDHAKYVRHGVAGYSLLHSLGWPEEIARFCSHHTGAGLTADDVVRQNLPLPVTDYLAETAEEELVMYADKFHSKTTPPRFVTADAYLATALGFGEATAARFTALREKFGDPDLPALARIFGHAVV